jgi:hypothetical protein
MEHQIAPKNLAWALVPLAVALAIGNTATFGVFHSGHAPNEIVGALCMAFMSATGSLLAVWIAFGRRALPVRLALAVPGVAIVVFPFLTLPNGILALASGLIAVVGLSLPSLGARAAGWRLVQFPATTDAENWQADDNPMQFTLRQMFSWTLAVAMVAGLMRMVIRPDEFQPGMGARFIADAAICIACGFVALAAAWATLGRRSPVRRLLAIAALSGLASYLILRTFSADSEFVLTIAGWAALDALLTGFGLHLFRAVGFRLVRHMRRTTIAAVEQVRVN